MSLGPWEIGLIVILVLIIFGAGKLPQIGDMIGKTIRNIRRATSDPLGDEEKMKTIDVDNKRQEDMSIDDLEREISRRKGMISSDSK